MPFLKRHQLKADKSFGQHFLISAPAVSAILDACARAGSILEIGPGPGILTRPLSDSFEHVHAVELDERMAKPLAACAPGVAVTWGDALKLNLPELVSGMPKPLVIVSNMPYYITGPLLGRVEELAGVLDRAVLMMQREVGDRILSPAGGSERGGLSVAMQCGFEISRVADVPPDAFFPPPKVDSVVLLFQPKPVSQSDRKALGKALNIGFAQRRKTLENNLSTGLRKSKAEIAEWLVELEISQRARPQELTNEEWWRLLKLICERVPGFWPV